MGLANRLNSYDSSREGSLRTIAAWLTFAQIHSGRSFAVGAEALKSIRASISYEQVFIKGEDAPNELLTGDPPFGLKPKEFLHQLPRA